MLTPKQQRFVDEYLIDLNAKQAAIRAGYSEKSAEAQGSVLLSTPKVKHAIQSKQLETQARTQVTADFVIGGLVEVANRCMQKVPVMEFDPVAKMKRQKIDEDTGNGVWEFDSGGANKALELLGKHLGVFEKDNGQKKAEVKPLTDDQFDKLVNVLNGKK